MRIYVRQTDGENRDRGKEEEVRCLHVRETEIDTQREIERERQMERTEAREKKKRYGVCGWRGLAEKTLAGK